MMYAFIRGKLFSASDDHAILDVGGVGYHLMIPPGTRTDLPPIGQEVLLYTSFVVREQSHTLYGFRYAQERDLFELLTTISGVGPKIALTLIGNLTLSDFRTALRDNDVKQLCRVKGIGKKSAERILIEMRDKLPLLYHELPQTSRPRRSNLSPVASDAVSALVNLGHTQSAAEARIEQALADLETEPNDLVTLLTHALRS